MVGNSVVTLGGVLLGAQRRCDLLGVVAGSKCAVVWRLPPCNLLSMLGKVGGPGEEDVGKPGRVSSIHTT